MLRGVETVIVDEIHALARDKRGSHLSITLERLAHLCEKPLQRIGLSATQAPIEEIARFLVGSRSSGKRKAEWRSEEWERGMAEGRRQKAEAAFPSPFHPLLPSTLPPLPIPDSPLLYRRRRPSAPPRPQYRCSAERIGSRLLDGAMGRSLRAAGPTHSLPSQHAGVREYSQAGRAGGAPASPNLGRGSSHRPIMAAWRGNSPRLRRTAEAGRIESDCRYGFAGNGHRRRLHRFGLPNRLAPLDRHVFTARRPFGALAGIDSQRPVVSAHAR